MKQFKIDGKQVIVKNGGWFPSKGTIKKVYRKIPDDKKVPIVFETKKQYLQEYMKNQEKLKHIKFSQKEKKQYIKSELHNMQGISSRFTTYHNPYMPPRVVYFNDRKMNNIEFEQNAMHEQGHELWEKNKRVRDTWSRNIQTNNTAPTNYGTTDPEEDFAESYAMYKTHTAPDANQVTSVNDLNKRMDIVKDAHSKNKSNNKKEMEYYDSLINKEIARRINNNEDPNKPILTPGELMAFGRVKEKVFLEDHPEYDNDSKNSIVSVKQGHIRYGESTEHHSDLMPDANINLRTHWEKGKPSAIKISNISHKMDFVDQVLSSDQNFSDLKLGVTQLAREDNVPFDTPVEVWEDTYGNASVGTVADYTSKNKRKPLTGYEDLRSTGTLPNPVPIKVNDLVRDAMITRNELFGPYRRKDPFEISEEKVEDDNDSKNYLRLSNRQNGKNLMYTHPTEDRDIFIDNAKNIPEDVDIISNAIAHEEMHNALKDISMPVSSALDNIAVPALRDWQNNGLANPRTVGTIQGIREGNIEAVRGEIGQEKFEKEDVENRMHHHYNNMMLRTKRLSSDDISKDYVDDEIVFDSQSINNFDNNYRLGGEDRNVNNQMSDQVQEGQYPR